MKKIIFSGVISLCMLFFTGCEDKLETEPTNQTSGTTIFSTEDNAMVALDGLYRLMYTYGWTSGNEHQSFGHMSVMIFTSLMGEDMIQSAQGNGWFWYDYLYNVRSFYTSKAWRSYDVWNYYYSLISNANYIIAAADNIAGTQDRVDYIIGSAKAVRAHCYFMLIQLFQQTYVGHENAPGIPLYTEPTTASSEGKGRGTVQEVYQQITTDLDNAITLLANWKQEDASHIDYYVANAIRAQVALVMNDWDKAASCAEEALKKEGCSLLNDFKFGMNDASNSSVMWGMSIIADQSTAFASFFSHMDATSDGFYAYSSYKGISSWLYNQISTTDKRKAWFQDAKGVTVYNAGTTKESRKNTPYSQRKFLWKDANSSLGDYIFMRKEEPLLIRAEALCHAGNYSAARQLMVELGEARDPQNYAAALAAVTDDNTISFASTGTVTTLMDYILIQRRIELWGETPRVFDIMRLRKDGWTRRFEGTNHPDAALLTKFGATSLAIPSDYKEMILTIPQSEFDGNPNMGANDQNPM